MDGCNASSTGPRFRSAFIPGISRRRSSTRPANLRKALQRMPRAGPKSRRPSSSRCLWANLRADRWLPLLSSAGQGAYHLDRCVAGPLAHRSRRAGPRQQHGFSRTHAAGTPGPNPLSQGRIRKVRQRSASGRVRSRRPRVPPRRAPAGRWKRQSSFARVPQSSSRKWFRDVSPRCSG
jgi:hypothetical protein